MHSYSNSYNNRLGLAGLIVVARVRWGLPRQRAFERRASTRGGGAEAALAQYTHIPKDKHVVRLPARATREGRPSLNRIFYLCL